MKQIIKQNMNTAPKMKFSVKDFFSKCASFLRIWSHLLKKSLMENFIFCAMNYEFISFGKSNGNSYLPIIKSHLKKPL